MKAFCEDCQKPQPVSQTPIRVGEKGTAYRWRFDVHTVNGTICFGSGKLV